MLIKDISFSSAEENISYDEKLLDLAEQGLSDETLRFWESPDFFIVLGRVSKPELDVNTDAADRDDVKIIKRRSGGGTVLQGPGCLNYSLILSLEKRPEIRDIKRSYEFIIGKICGAFNSAGVKAEFQPLSDMALSGRKFSGSAQWRRKNFMLHHGTILYNFPIEKMERYLKMPPDEPPYRKGRSHTEFLTNLKMAPADVKKVMEIGTAVPN